MNDTVDPSYPPPRLYSLRFTNTVLLCLCPSVYAALHLRFFLILLLLDEF